MAKNIFVVRGGKTTEADAEQHPGANGNPNVRYYDTLSGVAKAYKDANPNDKRSLKAIQLDIAARNNLKDRSANVGRRTRKEL